jgi:LuxR family maltose regulon positive regulatory protein
MAQNRLEPALGLVERLLQSAEASGKAGAVIKLLCLRALALRRQNEMSPALRALARALALAEPEGYVRMFLDEGPIMAELLRRGGSQGIAPHYVASLLAAWDAQPGAATPTARHQPLIEPLSERELEVLRLIADGLSNAEIASRLVVTVGTVKAHTSNLYGKLGVNTRTRAVAQARALGLL